MVELPIVSRTTIIIQKMLGQEFRVHNGKKFIIVLASYPRLGTKFGEYALTRHACVHTKKKKKKK